MTVYPGGIDSLPDNSLDSTATEDNHKTYHNNDADAIIAVETALGTNPRGVYADLKARATDSLKKSSDSDQVIASSGDFVGVAVKASAAQTADLIQVRSSADALITAIKSDGKIDAGVGYKVASSLLASTHLTDSALLAQLASPVFSGTPVAPTPSLSDSSATLATTAFCTNVFAQLLPPGTIIPYTGALPAGFLDTDGASYLRATYPNLFGVVGTTFGSIDGTHFNVPDLQGRVPVGKGTHADVNALGNNDGVALGSRRSRHLHGLGTYALAVTSHSLTDVGHVHTVTDLGHSHAATDPGHSHTKTDPGHSHPVNASHNHTASGSSGTQSSVHVHTYSLPTATITGSDTASSQTPLQFASSRVTDSGTNSVSHTHGITVWGDGGIGGGNPGLVATANLGALTINSGTTGISYASSTTGVTVNSGATGITGTGSSTMSSISGSPIVGNTLTVTGVLISDHTATPGGTLGTSVGAPSESAAYLVLRYCIKT